MLQIINSKSERPVPRDFSEIRSDILNERICMLNVLVDEAETSVCQLQARERSFARQGQERKGRELTCDAIASRFKGR